jgi:flagellar biogenesis protein FliO
MRDSFVPYPSANGTSMSSWRLIVGLCLSTLLWGASVELHAQTPPNTNEPQVLFSFDRKQGEAAPAKNQAATNPIVDTATDLETPPLAPLPKPVVRTDTAVQQVAATAKVPAETPIADSRRLIPRKDPDPSIEAGKQPTLGKLPFELPDLSSLGTAGTGLVLVVGLFLLCASLMRRGGPSPTSPLPRDAVAVLGRIPLTPKQFAHLLQVGNKLVLVSITGERTDTITEVTDPMEVDRLLSLCMKGSKQSSSAEFNRVLQQLSREPAHGFLGRDAASSRR